MKDNVNYDWYKVQKGDKIDLVNNMYMKEFYNKLNALQHQVEMMIREVAKEYEQRLQNITDYIETHFFGLDEVGEDLLKLATGEYERLCSYCSKPMSQGYVIENGSEYYCSDDCLHEVYTDEEYNRLYDDGNGDSYWTEW